MCWELTKSFVRRFIVAANLILTPWIAPWIISDAHAATSYSPSDVYAGVEYANRLADEILVAGNITDMRIPQSRERNAKPMHVYEMHVSVLMELYTYALKNERRPPPQAVSTPIKYTPTDVFHLTRLVMSNLEDIYRDGGKYIDFTPAIHTGKTPADVYQELFALYYRLNRLNGKSKISPSEVYAHIFRAKEDLQLTLLALAKRLDGGREDQKRMLVTAIYGMHPDGTVLAPLEKGKTPGDVLKKALDVRGKLNTLRAKNKLAEIAPPKPGDFSNVKPIDVFLQTQFIIAELNLLKIPLDIHTTTNSAKPVSGKKPSDVFQEMKHIEYMLDRLILAL